MDRRDVAVKSGVITYALVALFTFGYVAVDAGEYCDARPPVHDTMFCQAFAAPIGAASWPLYWSVKLARGDDRGG